jgi:hypothetical protein
MKLFLKHEYFLKTDFLNMMNTFIPLTIFKSDKHFLKSEHIFKSDEHFLEHAKLFKNQWLYFFAACGHIFF